MGGGVVNTTPSPLYPRERTGTLCIEVGWVPRAVWTGTENLAPTRIRSPDRPARSESLYRLNCPCPICVCRSLVFYAVFVNSYMWGVTGRCIQRLGSWTWRRETICSTLNVHRKTILTLSLLTSYIYIYMYGAPSKARNFNVVYIWTYVWQRWKSSLSICCTMFQSWINAESFLVLQLCVNTLPPTKITLITDGIKFGSLRVKVNLKEAGRGCVDGIHVSHTSGYYVVSTVRLESY
jgi:hypothetical protein